MYTPLQTPVLPHALPYYTRLSHARALARALTKARAKLAKAEARRLSPPRRALSNEPRLARRYQQRTEIFTHDQASTRRH